MPATDLYTVSIWFLIAFLDIKYNNYGGVVFGNIQKKNIHNQSSVNIVYVRVNCLITNSIKSDFTLI